MFAWNLAWGLIMWKAQYFYALDYKWAFNFRLATVALHYTFTLRKPQKVETGWHHKQ